MRTKGLLHDKSQAPRLLELMTDTLLLVKFDGTCVDMIVKTENNPFVNAEKTLLGKNIFECFPEETLKDLKPAIEHVFRTGETSNATTIFLIMRRCIISNALFRSTTKSICY